MSDIATTGSSFFPARYAGESWVTLAGESREIFGADLEKGDLLIGVPFCAIEFTYRPGIVNVRTGDMMFYVSIDIITGPSEDIARAIRRGRIPEANAGMIEPGEHLVFNEGGTGVYRQTVAYLEDTGRIQIKGDLPKEGRYGESRYDIPPSKWNVNEDGTDFRADDAGNPTLGFPVRILCPRGLRVSNYENEYSKSAVTRYLA